MYIDKLAHHFSEMIAKLSHNARHHWSQFTMLRNGVPFSSHRLKGRSLQLTSVAMWLCSAKTSLSGSPLVIIGTMLLRCSWSIAFNKFSMSLPKDDSGAWFNYIRYSNVLRDFLHLFNDQKHKENTYSNRISPLATLRWIWQRAG